MSNTAFTPVTKEEIAEFLELREDDIIENDLDVSDLSLVKPAVMGNQGIMQFDRDGSIQSAENIEGVIIHSQPRRALIKGEGDNRETLCQSQDGVTGVGDPLGQGEITENPCVTCPMAQWGSIPSGGKACREYRTLGVMLGGDVYPSIVNVPPTSLKAFKRYVSSVQKSRKRVNNTVTRISPVVNPHPSGAYASLGFSYAGELPEDSKDVYRALRKEVTPMLASAPVQTALPSGERRALNPPPAADQPSDQANTSGEYDPPEHFDGPPPGHDVED